MPNEGVEEVGVKYFEEKLGGITTRCVRKTLVTRHERVVKKRNCVT